MTEREHECVAFLRAQGWECIKPTARGQIGTVTFDHLLRRLIAPAGHWQLKRHEYAVLAKLARWPGRIVERSDLIAAMYANDDEPDSAEEILRLAIMSLRTTLRAMRAGVTIRTERSIGYAMERE